MPSDREAIERRRREWIDAVNAHDVLRYVQILTEDVVWFPPGQDALSGRDAFVSWVRPFFDRFSYEFASREPEVQVAGDWAFERGIFESKMTSLDDRSRAQHAGRYLVIWRRDSDDVWRIERYVDQTQLRAKDADSV